MPGEERIFGPHEYETYRQYRSRLRDDRSMTASRAAALMATAMLMQGKANEPVDREKLYELEKKLRQQPAFRMMMKDKRAAELLRSGGGSGLIGLMAAKEEERQRSFDKYKRPSEKVKEDARLLNSAVEGLRKNPPPADAGAGTGDPEQERQGKLYREMMKRLEEAGTLADSGVPLSGERTKALITAVKAYNDGGRKELPGGEAPAAGQLEAMSLLKQFLPEREFRGYCRRINLARGLEGPDSAGYLAPESFVPERLTEGAKTAKEWYAESQTRLMKTFSVEGCAEAAAIRKLSEGSAHKVLRREDLDREVKELCTPGSAFMRAMGDDKAREQYARLAAAGKPEALSENLLSAAWMHSARAAQWQINRSARELVSGPVNVYVASENLANILAARELARRGSAGEPITNGAFRARAEQLMEDPSFQRMAERYSEDPAFRRRMNRELMRDRTGKSLQSVYDRLSGREAEAGREQPEVRREQPEVRREQPELRREQPELRREQPEPAPAP